MIALLVFLLVYPVVGIVGGLAYIGITERFDYEPNLVARIGIGIIVFGIVAYLAGAAYVVSKIDRNPNGVAEAKETLTDFFTWVKTGG